MQAVQQLNQVEITGTLDVKKESDTNINVNDNVSVIVSFMRLGKLICAPLVPTEFISKSSSNGSM